MASGYTRTVSWKQRISVVVLVVLAALPVSGIVCALICDSAAKTTSAHHGTNKDCEESPGVSNGPQIQGVSEHDCSNHDAAVRRVATTVAERIDLRTAPAVFAGLASFAYTSLPARAATFEYTSPPGSAPPTTTPLVLRV